jgi:hypothetical protein
VTCFTAVSYSILGADVACVNQIGSSSQLRHIEDTTRTAPEVTSTAGASSQQTSREEAGEGIARMEPRPCSFAMLAGASKTSHNRDGGRGADHFHALRLIRLNQKLVSHFDVS